MASHCRYICSATPARHGVSSPPSPLPLAPGRLLPVSFLITPTCFLCLCSFQLFLTHLLPSSNLVVTLISPSPRPTVTPPVHQLADPGKCGVPGRGAGVPARAATCPRRGDLPRGAWREAGHRGPHRLRQVFPVSGTLPAAGAQCRASAPGRRGHQPAGAGRAQVWGQEIWEDGGGQSSRKVSDSQGQWADRGEEVAR